MRRSLAVLLFAFAGCSDLATAPIAEPRETEREGATPPPASSPVGTYTLTAIDGAPVPSGYNVITCCDYWGRPYTQIAARWTEGVLYVQPDGWYSRVTWHMTFPFDGGGRGATEVRGGLWTIAEGVIAFARTPHPSFEADYTGHTIQYTERVTLGVGPSRDVTFTWTRR